MKNVPKTTTALAIACLSLHGASALADHRHHHDHCPTQATSRVVGTRVLSYHGGCSAGTPNTIGRTHHAYPLMGGRDYEVDYWQGTYRQPALLQDIVEYDYYDCYGGFEGAEEASGTAHEGFAEFAVANPNLSDDISVSFALVPMTDAEAAVALVAARQACEAAH